MVGLARLAEEITRESRLGGEYSKVYLRPAHWVGPKTGPACLHCDLLGAAPLRASYAEGRMDFTYLFIFYFKYLYPAFLWQEQMLRVAANTFNAILMLNKC